MSNTVLINFEGRISHIDETKNLRIVPTSSGDFRENARCTYEQFINFAEYVLSNKIKFKYLIIDTLDAMLQTFIKGMLRKGEIQDKYYGRAEAYPKITDYIQRFKDNGTTVIITAQENDKELKTDLLIVPNFKGHINQIVDGCFYLKLVNNNKRVLLIKPTDMVFVKPPTVNKEKFNDIVDTIEDPTWDKIIEVLNA